MSSNPEGWDEWEGEECLAEPSKLKRPREEVQAAKRAKLDPTPSWGEAVPERVVARDAFLQSSNQEVGVSKSQTTIKVYCDLEWLCLELVREMA